MISRLFFICTVLLLISCASQRNEFGRLRPNSDRFTVKPDTSNIINKEMDTSAFYLRVSKNDIDYMFDINNDKRLIRDVGIGFKFYSKGKVGMFYNIDFNDNKTLNPKRAVMGFYQEINGELYLEFLLNHVQSGNFLVKKEVLVSENSFLKIKSYKKAISPEYISTYEKVSLPKAFLIYKPDW